MSKNKYIRDLVQRYESSLGYSSVYFDADQFIDIIDYYDEQGDLDAAAEVLHLALSIHSENEALKIKQAKLLIFEESYQEALDLLLSLPKTYDLDNAVALVECYLALGDRDKAQKYTDFVMSSSDPDISDILSDLGFIYADYDDCSDEVILIFEKLLSLPSVKIEDVNIYLELANAYENKLDYYTSVYYINQALNINSYSEIAWLNLGKVYMLLGDYPQATDAFDYALVICPDDIEIQKMKGHCLMFSGRALEALEFFKEIYANTVNSPDPSILLALFDCYMTLEDYGKALAVLQLYEVKHGKSIDQVRKMASLFMQQGDYAGAVKILENALSEFGFDDDYRFMLAEAYFENKEPLKAHPILLQLKDEIGTLDILTLLVSVELQLGNLLDAVMYSEEIYEEDSSDKKNMLGLALLYFDLGYVEKFDKILKEMDKSTLKQLLQVYYTPKNFDLFTKQSLISTLNNVLETKMLFKNIKY